MPHATRPGDVLADRYQLVDLLLESRGGRFWRARDRVLERDVAIHVIGADDPRAGDLMEAARCSATVADRRMLRVLDAELDDELCYVVNEWGWGASLDIVLSGKGPLGPRRASWLVAEVADSMAAAHEAGIVHGRLNPENVLIDRGGGVRIIGTCVDAALHGVVRDDPDHDVADLGGLLYCALTTRWAGPSSSDVPAAPSEHGHVLRPRRVRAGIPRVLDSLCDELLDAASVGRHRELVDLELSARGIADLLLDYVGDTAGMSEALVASTPEILPEEEQVVLPPVPELTPHDLLHDDAPRHDTADRPTDPPADPTPPSRPRDGQDVPTEAGVPIFGEEDDVSWLERRTTPPPPPPPFEEPPERPLFAPEPADGAPARKARPGRAESGGDGGTDGGFWPWSGDTDAGARDTGRETGAVVPRRPRGRWDTGEGLGSDTGSDTGFHEGVPGRNWLRLATVVGVVILLVVAVVVAVNLRRDSGGADSRDDDVTPSTTPTDPSPSTPPNGPDQPPATLSGLTASALDPQGDDGDENDDEAPAAVDGDPATSWATQGYNDPFTSARGLKTGVGLVVDLGGERDVEGVDLQLVGAPTAVSVYLSESSPSDVDGLEPAATATATGDTVSLDARGPASHVVVWFTDLPRDASDGRYRARLAEVVVRGA